MTYPEGHLCHDEGDGGLFFGGMFPVEYPPEDIAASDAVAGAAALVGVPEGGSLAVWLSFVCEPVPVLSVWAVGLYDHEAGEASADLVLSDCRGIDWLPLRRQVLAEAFELLPRAGYMLDGFKSELEEGASGLV